MMPGPLVCIQCAMEAMLENEQPPTFDEEPEEHMMRCHPDPDATQRRRIELEQMLLAMMKPVARD